MGMKAAVDAEFKDLIPPLSEQEYAALEASIQAEGCLHPVVTWQGVIIDGHHRVEICRKLVKPYRIVEKKFANRDDAKLWALTHQLARRNLNDYQRSVIALKQEALIASRGRQGQRTDLSPNPTKGPPLDTREEIAKIAGVSPATVSQVKRVKEKAIPEIEKAAATDAISINAAAQLAGLPVEEQIAAAAGGVQGLKQKTKQLAAEASVKKRAKASQLNDIETLEAENRALKSEIDELKRALAEAEVEIRGLRATPEVDKGPFGDDDVADAVQPD